MKRRRLEKRLPALVVAGFACILFLLPVTPVLAQAAQAQAGLLVLIFQSPDGPDQVAITYARQVDHAEALRELDQLRTSTGWTMSEPQISDEPPPIPALKGKMTSVTFSAPDAVDTASHTLAIGPFAEAFRAYRSIIVTYVVSPNFHFQGLHDYSDSHVRIAMSHQGTAYTYEVQIKDPRFGTLGLPRYQLTVDQLRMAAARAADRRHSLPLRIALVALAAVGAFGIVYYFMSRQI